MSATRQTAEHPAAEAEAREDLRQLSDVIEYLDTHDIGDELDGVPKVHFEINLPPRQRRYALNTELSEQLGQIARQRGVPAEDLLNQWVREKAAESQTAGTAK